MQHSATTAPQPTDSEAERAAYNSAFAELGLPWHWDTAMHQRLSAHGGASERLHQYLHAEQAHLLRAYDADFLVHAIQDAKARCQGALVSPRR